MRRAFRKHQVRARRVDVAELAERFVEISLLTKFCNDRILVCYLSSERFDTKANIVVSWLVGCVVFHTISCPWTSSCQYVFLTSRPDFD